MVAGFNSCIEKQSGTTVVFHEVSSHVQITSFEKKHFYASYYGINSWSKDQQYATVLEKDIKYKLTDENDPATLGLADLETKELINKTKFTIFPDIIIG